MDNKVSAIALMTALFASAASQAQTDSTTPKQGLFDTKHLISIGGTWQSTKTTIRATTENFDPEPITLRELGANERDTSYFIDYRYRFKPNWSVFAGTYQFTGSGQSQSQHDFNYDGVEFEAGLDLESKFEIDIYMVNVLYTVHRSDKLEIMLGGGVHAFDLSAEVSGSASINDQSSEVRRAGGTLLAPVPNVRGAATWDLSDRFGLSLVGGWLSANVQDYSGDFVYAHLRGYYKFTENFGVSLGYQLTNIDISRDRARSDIAFDSELDGPSFTLTYSF
jgi:opacity protein-like surface antigen